MFAALVLAVGVGVDADGLMSQVIARARETAKLRHERGLTGTKREQKYNTAKNPEQLIGTKTWRLEMGPHGLLQQLVETSGTPVTGGPLEPPKLDIDTFIDTMDSRYRFSLKHPGPVSGYYEVAFEPRDPPAPASTSEETVINRLSGIVYIEERGLFVHRIRSKLKRPFSIAVSGRVEETTIEFDQELFEGIPVPRRSVCTARYSKGFGLVLNTATRSVITYEYNPLPVPPTPHP